MTDEIWIQTVWTKKNPVLDHIDRINLGSDQKPVSKEVNRRNSISGRVDGKKPDWDNLIRKIRIQTEWEKNPQSDHERQRNLDSGPLDGEIPFETGWTEKVWFKTVCTDKNRIQTIWTKQRQIQTKLNKRIWFQTTSTEKICIQAEWTKQIRFRPGWPKKPDSDWVEQRKP